MLIGTPAGTDVMPSVTASVSPLRSARTKSRPGSRKEDGAVGEPATPQQDRLTAAEEAFAERLAPLVERWRARIVGAALEGGGQREEEQERDGEHVHARD